MQAIEEAITIVGGDAQDAQSWSWTYQYVDADWSSVHDTGFKFLQVEK